MQYRNLVRLVFVLNLILLFIPANLVSAQSLTLEEIRRDFPKASKDESACGELYSKMELSANKTDPIWMAYHGTITVMLAKYSMNPFRKLQYFKSGRILIDQSLLKDPNNIELRFLRFTVQDHTPFFLDYHEDLENDKKFILAQLEKVPFPLLKKAIIHYIAESDRFSAEEKKLVSKLGGS